MSLVLAHLTRRYGAVTALHDVSCDIPAGQRVGLLGANGAGKSTLLRIAATLLTPTSGEVTVAGFSLQRDPDRIRQILGYLPEAPPSDPALTVAEYLQFRGTLKGLTHRHLLRAVDRQLSDWRLTGVSRQRVDRLSLGFRRRVGLADALLAEPRVLLLDEPTIGLDPLQVVETRNLLRALAGRVTVVVSTHLLTEVELLCERALVLRSGALVADLSLDPAARRAGTMFELDLRGPAELVRATLAPWGSLQGPPTLPADTWRLETSLPAPELARLCVAAGLELHGFRHCQASLEDRLLGLSSLPLPKAA